LPGDKRAMEPAISSTDESQNAPLCPSCGRPMRLKRAVPRLGALPELRTYDCAACGVTYTQAVEVDGDVALLAE
jgi:hypothetical protein